MAEKKTIELWEGYKVELNEQLLDDYDFIADLSKAEQSRDLPTLVAMHFALVGGEKIYQDARDYLTKKCGYVSTEEMGKIFEKIKNEFPKAGNRAQKRSWQTSN